MNNYYLAIDPGKDKCGLAILDDKKNHYVLKNSYVTELEQNILQITENYQINKIILGNGTGYKQIQQIISKTLPKSLIIIMDEKNTTYLAKQIYWQHNKPKGWQKVLPKGLRTVPEPLDSYAALAIGIRWLEQNC